MVSPTVFELQPVPPFRLDLTVWTLRRRPENVIDRWDGRTYRRVLAPKGRSPFEIAVCQVGPVDAPRLSVTLAGAAEADQFGAIQALDRLLGINLNMEGFYRLAEADGALRLLADEFRGFKPPRFSSNFETLVNAMSCQQLSLTVGILLLCRLAERYGPCLTMDEGIHHAFPRPEDVAGADLNEMRALGFSYQKARYITRLAQAIVDGEVNLGQLETLDDQAALDRLRGLKGVGRWTAEYFLLRGLGRTHIFPADDVGARNNLQRWLRLRAPMKYEKVQRVLKPWQGYGGLIYFHLLLKSLSEKGVLVN